MRFLILVLLCLMYACVLEGRQHIYRTHTSFATPSIEMFDPAYVDEFALTHRWGGQWLSRKVFQLHVILRTDKRLAKDERFRIVYTDQIPCVDFPSAERDDTTNMIVRLGEWEGEGQEYAAADRLRETILRDIQIDREEFKASVRDVLESFQ